MEKSFSVYIHIPYCVSKCRYCDFFSLPCKSLSQEYVDALCKEMTRLSGVKVDTVYTGGGTPSLLKPSQIKKIFDSLKENCSLSDNAEITFEVNPDDVSEELLKALEAAGVNRISCGLQSMNDKALSFAGRRADAAANRRALEIFKQHWNKLLSLDFICGLPEETEESFIEGLKEALQYAPSHISMYSLTIEDETPFGKELISGTFEYDYDFADQLWLKGRDFLTNHSYRQYEVSNFSLKGAECRHNLAYWNHKDYFGLGSGATGTQYLQNGEGIRLTNTQNIKEYVDFWLHGAGKNPQVSEKIDLKTSEFEFFMMGMRKISGISEAEFRQIFNKALPDYFIKLCNKWKERGLCDITDRYALNEQGLLFLNSFLLELQ